MKTLRKLFRRMFWMFITPTEEELLQDKDYLKAKELFDITINEHEKMFGHKPSEKDLRKILMSKGLKF